MKRKILKDEKYLALFLRKKKSLKLLETKTYLILFNKMVRP